MFRAAAVFAMLALLTACVEVTTSPKSPSAQVRPAPASAPASAAAARSFGQVVARVEPVAERECRMRTRNVNCDFRILVDNRPGVPANAFQTLEKNGRPVIAFTVKLIEDVQNSDELAFVMAHEAAHHIEAHIARQQQNALAGAVLLGGLAAVTGGDSSTVETAQRLGATVGARSYSKEFELEADALGTVIAARAGYNPVVGAMYFNRIPDPGNRFLGTHPPNAQRLEVVRRTASRL